MSEQTPQERAERLARYLDGVEGEYAGSSEAIRAVLAQLAKAEAEVTACDGHGYFARPAEAGRGRAGRAAGRDQAAGPRRGRQRRVEAKAMSEREQTPREIVTRWLNQVPPPVQSHIREAIRVVLTENAVERRKLNDDQRISDAKTNEYERKQRDK